MADRDRRAAELLQALSERDEALAALRRQVRDMSTLAAALKEQGAQQVRGGACGGMSWMQEWSNPDSSSQLGHQILTCSCGFTNLYSRSQCLTPQPPPSPQAASLERLERAAVASEAEAASLRGELHAAQQQLHAAQQVAAKLRAAEGQLAQLRGSHSELQAAHGALQAAHSQQGARLSATKQRLSDVLAGQEGLAAAAASARQEAEQLRGEAVAARQQLQAAEREAATFRGRFQAVQAANDSLRVQVLATGGTVSGSAAGGTGSGRKVPPPTVDVPPLPSPRFTTGLGGPAQSPGCRITAAAAATAQCKAGLVSRTSSLESEIGATIPAVLHASPASQRTTVGVAVHRSPRSPATRALSG